ncbi:Uncharacterised protein [Vibrio cholerae]|nr:Uncharacterised protein [Vibrio cholerae]CSD16894.1 Uncharacterised protein [Vibrio cholerae]CSI45936.1 Uncharacterised protein [Vibrio cholerae]CSI71147.1 Uncharacterised protein [Vibrio cholerae]
MFKTSLKFACLLFEFRINLRINRNLHCLTHFWDIFGSCLFDSFEDPFRIFERRFLQ